MQQPVHMISLLFKHRSKGTLCKYIANSCTSFLFFFKNIKLSQEDCGDKFNFWKWGGKFSIAHFPQKISGSQYLLAKLIWGYFIGSSHLEPYWKLMMPTSVRGNGNMVMVVSSTKPFGYSARTKKKVGQSVKMTIVFIHFLTSESFQDVDQAVKKVHGLVLINGYLWGYMAETDHCLLHLLP